MRVPSCQSIEAKEELLLIIECFFGLMNQQKRILYKMIHIQVLIIDIQYPTLSGMSVRAHTGLLQTVYTI